MRQVLGNFLEDSTDDQGLDRLPNAFSKLTGPTYGLSDIIKAGREGSAEKEAPPPPQGK